MKNIIIFNLALLLSGSLFSQKAEVTFSPVWETLKFSQRNTPAKLTKESEESLIKSEYVYIGFLSVTETLKTYWGDESFGINCAENLVPDNFTDEIAKKVASFGGDLVVWNKGSVKENEVTKHGKCLISERMPAGTETYSDRGYTVTRTIYQDVCVSWQTISGKECNLHCGGEIWRKKDLEVTNLLEKEELLNNVLGIEEEKAFKIFRIKPINESELKELLAKSEESQKPLIMEKWWFYNRNLWMELISAGLQPEDEEDDLKPFLDEKSQLYGYIDKSGRTVSPPSFDVAEIFIGGVARVTVNGKYGYIDKTGKLYIPKERMRPKDESKFKEVIAKFEESEKYHAMGKWWRYNYDLWAKNMELWQYNNNLWKEDLDKWELNRDLWGDYDRDLMGNDTTQGELIRFKNPIGVYGYRDKRGNVVIQPAFDEASDFSDGLACVKLYKDNKFGFINKTGNWVIAPTFDYSTEFVSGVAQVRFESGKEGYMDKTGKIYMADEIKEPIELPNNWNTFNLKRMEKLSYKASKDESEFNEILAKLPEDKRYEAMTKRYSKYLSRCSNWEDTIETIWAKKTDNGDYVIVLNTENHDECYCGYDDNNRIVVIEPQFINCKEFSEGLASVCITEGKTMKCGYIDKSGNWIIPPLYETANKFCSGVASVRINGRRGMIDKSGKLYMEPE
jgi:hypothetical protein